VEYDLPADRIVADQGRANEFANLVNSKLPDPLRLSVQECSRITLNIRRKGEGHNGLPRLRGGHGGHGGHGRSPQP